MTSTSLATADGFDVEAVSTDVTKTLLGVIQGTREYIWQQKVDRAIETATRDAGPMPWIVFQPEGLDRAKVLPPKWRVKVRLNSTHILGGDDQERSMDGSYLGIIFFTNDAMHRPLVDVIGPYAARIVWRDQARNWAW